MPKEKSEKKCTRCGRMFTDGNEYLQADCREHYLKMGKDSPWNFEWCSDCND